jgi:hypothetical protein
MGKARLRLGVLLVLLVATGLSAGAQGSSSMGRGIERLAAEMADLFPKLEGDVVKVERDQVFITLGASDQVREGMELSLARKGEEFKHPLTGVVLGRFEEDVGVLVISQVAESYSSGTVRPASPNITARAGDKVRITKGKIAVALLPLEGELPAWLSRDDLLDRLRSALEQTGRFQVTAADNVRVYLAEKGVPPEGVLSQEVVGRMAQDLRVTYGVLSRTRQVSGEAALEVRLLGLSHQSTLLTSSAVLPEPVARAEPERSGRAADSGRTRPEVRPGLFKEPRKAPGYHLDLSNLDLGKTMKELLPLPMVVTSMDVGDLSGEGTEDIAISDGKKVSVYRLTGEQVELVDQYIPDRSLRVLTVQYAEIDGRPGQEIIVNQFLNNNLDTTILTYRNGRLQILQDHLDDMLVAVDTDGDGIKETIWGQGYDLNDFFTTGRAARFAMTNGKLKRQGSVVVPKVFRATGVALADTNGNGRRDLVLIDESRQLRVYRGKEQLYKSSDRVGGSYSAADVPRSTGRSLDVTVPYFMEPWMAVADLDGDGRDDVIVPRNVRSVGNYLPNVNIYSGGDVVVLSQKDFGYSLTAITPQFDGLVSGVAMLRQRSYPAFLVAVSQGTLFGGGHSIILLSRRP